MAFTIPENLPEDLYPLAWLIGTWSGKGQGEYAGIAPFQFIQASGYKSSGRLSGIVKAMLVRFPYLILRKGRCFGRNITPYAISAMPEMIVTNPSNTEVK